MELGIEEGCTQLGVEREWGGNNAEMNEKKILDFLVQENNERSSKLTMIQKREMQRARGRGAV